MIEFYNKDCLEGMKSYPDKYFDLAIVDPPYGNNFTSRHKIVDSYSVMVSDNEKPRAFGGNKGLMRGYSSKSATKSKLYHMFDDSKTPDKEYFTELFRVSKNQIIWGGNFLLDYLNKCSCMIVWDKGRRGLDQADCEIAWTSLAGQSRIFNYKWNGMLQEDMLNKEERIHPTQKPVALYKWLLTNYANKGDKILDTHTGSASSLIACYDLGFDAIGFEIDEVYYRQAKQRLEDHQKQVSIFDLLN